MNNFPVSQRAKANICSLASSRSEKVLIKISTCIQLFLRYKFPIIPASYLLFAYSSIFHTDSRTFRTNTNTKSGYWFLSWSPNRDDYALPTTRRAKRQSLIVQQNFWSMKDETLITTSQSKVQQTVLHSRVLVVAVLKLFDTVCKMLFFTLH